LAEISADVREAVAH